MATGEGADRGVIARVALTIAIASIMKAEEAVKMAVPGGKVQAQAEARSLQQQPHGDTRRRIFDNGKPNRAVSTRGGGGVLLNRVRSRSPPPGAQPRPRGSNPLSGESLLPAGPAGA
ncbi:Protein of unknown function [Gryllus bimaculatus]|nr:Protein of unknown function [Gryllus bimaculatus]